MATPAQRSRLVALMDGWAAGLFEGEGCFSLRTHKGGSKHVVASMTSTDKDVLDTFARVVGVGNVRARRESKPVWKQAWIWSVSGPDAERVYALIEPWLHGRRRQRYAAIIAERREYETRQHAIRSEAARRGQVAAWRTRRERYGPTGMRSA